MWEVVSAHRSEQRMGRCWRWRRRGDNAVITNSTQGWEAHAVQGNLLCAQSILHKRL